MSPKENVVELLAERVLHEPVQRPTLGDSVNIRILQDRAILYALSPGTSDLLYFAGRELGTAYARKVGLKKPGLKEALEASAGLAEKHKLGRNQVVNVDDGSAVVRMHECATSYGLPNLGLRVCAFDAGIQAGFFAQLLGKRVVSSETKCNANGEEYCEFEIRVLPTVEAAFAEAFRP